jgi:hypothetical protein
MYVCTISLILIFRSLFIGEKKPALVLDFAVKKLAESFPGSIETRDVEGELYLLSYRRHFSGPVVLTR